MSKLMNLLKRNGFVGTGKSIIKIIISKIILFAAPFLPRSNTIVFRSIPDYADNARALYRYMREAGYLKAYTVCWILSGEENPPKELENVRILNENSNKISIAYTLARAEWVLYTHSSGVPSNYRIPKNQKLIALWHGCSFKGRRSKGHTVFDAVLVPGALFVETKTKFFSCDPSKVLPIGYPRYDYFLRNIHHDASLEQMIEKNNNKVVFWMPTYRENDNGFSWMEGMSTATGLPLIETTEQLKEIDTFCAQHKILLVIKKHPFQRKYKLPSGIQLTNIIMLDNEDFAKADLDLYEALREADALITDYSSVGIDYLLLDRPIAFILDDFDEYDKRQGFIVDDPKKLMPGWHLYDLHDMENFLFDVSAERDLYGEEREEMKKIMHNPCECYCERICQAFGFKKSEKEVGT